LESSAIDQAAKVQRDKAGFLKSTGKEEGMPSSLAELSDFRSPNSNMSSYDRSLSQNDDRAM
jgi:hypothetical protein